jgi:hypothetical protein
MIDYYIIFLATTPFRKTKNTFKSLQGSPGCLRHRQPDEPHDEPPLHEEAEEFAELAA